MANGRRGRPIVRSVRRPTFWEGGRIDAAIATGTAVTSVIVSEATLENSPNPTIVRCRGELLVMITAAGAASTANFTSGLIVVTADALAAGAVPSPLSDIGSDWLWWSNRGLRSLAGGSASDEDGAAGIVRVPIDSKAMRKVGLNQALILVSAMQPETLTISVHIVGAIRVLLKR